MSYEDVRAWIKSQPSAGVLQSKFLSLSDYESLRLPWFLDAILLGTPSKSNANKWITRKAYKQARNHAKGILNRARRQDGDFAAMIHTLNSYRLGHTVTIASVNTFQQYIIDNFCNPNIEPTK